METATQTQDAQSVERVLRGEREEFRGLVERHFTKAYAAALARTGNAVEAEDIVQEAFLRAFVKLDKLKKPDRFGAWVVQIARNSSRSPRSTRSTELVVPRSIPITLLMTYLPIRFGTVYWFSQMTLQRKRNTHARRIRESE